MDDAIHLSDLRAALDELSYPIDRTEVVDEVSGVTVLYADGEEPLADLIARAPATTFESVDELSQAAVANAPIEAVGEPGQSEGDA